jgi:hypothetical protein
LIFALVFLQIWVFLNVTLFANRVPLGGYGKRFERLVGILQQTQAVGRYFLPQDLDVF